MSFFERVTMYIADLHIHSKYSMATSKDCDAVHLDLWARKKGITLVGTGDFTHPAWRAELEETLKPAEEGLYTLKGDCRLPSGTANEAAEPRFVISGEISSIYKKDGRTRKVHNLIFLPGLEDAQKLAKRLEAIGNIRSDGRPILGLDSRDLLEITLDACPAALFVPAHIWTPHFSVFGAFSGFATIEECFGDLAGEICALETGLSSDPAMNWRVSALDRFTLISNSDAHSPAKLGREANVFETGLSYPEMAQALKTGRGFAKTLEFFPEEGKYHLDGHRNCQTRLTPEETAALGGLCPVCGRKVTVGVAHRLCELADRPEGFVKPNAKPFESLVPLPELIASATGFPGGGKKVQAIYDKMLHALGPEFFILREAPKEEIERLFGPLVAEGVLRVREGRVKRIAGYDGEYGKIVVFEPEERDALSGQTTLFGPRKEGRTAKTDGSGKAATAKKQKKTVNEPPKTGASRNARPEDDLNPEQRCAVMAKERAVAVIAGPGTGKTKTLVARIAYLVESLGVPPSSITAVTFTNQAAKEMRSRLEARLGGKGAAGAMTIGTFHAVCLGLLDKKPLLGEGEALGVLKEILAEKKSKASPRDMLRRISLVKNGMTIEQAGLPGEIYEEYLLRLKALGARDLDDLLTDALSLDCAPNSMFTHLLVDEFQDISAAQRKLVLHWSKNGESLFVIGDPDQSIYGFRGASAGCFDELSADDPNLRTISLKTNYRSTPNILNAAKRVISHNPGGERTAEASRKAGLPARVIRAQSPFDEAVWIAKEIAKMAGGTDMLAAHEAAPDRETFRPFSEIAVLCRTRRRLELIESCLRQDGIPCVVYGRGDYLLNDAVRGALAFFRFAADPKDPAALADCLALCWNVEREQAQKIASEARAVSALSEGEYLLALSGRGAPLGLIAEAEGYIRAVKKEKPARLLERFIAAHGGGPALDRLLETAIFHESMGDLLNTLALGAEQDVRRSPKKSYASGAVRLMTLHGAKGLEFPAVFLAGVSEGELPLVRPERKTDTQEERRLFFVGITRAMDELVITCSPPGSPFLQELPKEGILETVIRQKASQKERQLTIF